MGAQTDSANRLRRGPLRATELRWVASQLRSMAARPARKLSLLKVQLRNDQRPLARVPFLDAGFSWPHLLRWR